MRPNGRRRTSARASSPGAALPASSVRACPGRLSALSAFHSKSVLCGAFVWARRALSSPVRWFSARAVQAKYYGEAIGIDPDIRARFQVCFRRAGLRCIWRYRHRFYRAWMENTYLFWESGTENTKRIVRTCECVSARARAGQPALRGLRAVLLRLGPGARRSCRRGCVCAVQLLHHSAAASAAAAALAAAAAAFCIYCRRCGRRCHCGAATAASAERSGGAQKSFDPDYDTLPLSFFAPMVEIGLGRSVALYHCASSF